MKDTNEKILDAWVQLIMAVNSERLVTDMPFNEAVICNLLYRNKENLHMHILKFLQNLNLFL